MSRAVRLGAFILFALAIFFAGVFWIGGKQFLFTSTYRLGADFQNVTGLLEGAEVRVGGIHQGTVKGIDLPRHPGEKVRVLMNLKRATREVVKKDSIAVVRAEGLIGDKYVEVSFGSEQAAKVDDGDVIQSEPPLEISDLIKKANGILDSAQGAMESVDDTADNLKTITAKINQGSGTMGALINDREMYKSASAAATALQEDTEALKHNFLLRGFFHKRGYESAADLKKHPIAELPSRAFSKKFSYDAAKIFDKPDNAKLKGAKALKEAGEYLQGNPFGLAVVRCYAGPKGDSEKVRVLTEARAMVVRDYLVQNFEVDDTRVKTMGVGKSEGEGGVEVLVYPAGTEAPAGQRAPGAKQ